MESKNTFAGLAQRDARELAARLGKVLDEAEALFEEGRVLSGAIDAKVGVPSPLGLAPTYPGLAGPVVAVLRAPEPRAAIARWKALKAQV
jgi:hypothetical protein